jgi:hypothetical protein
MTLEEYLDLTRFPLTTRPGLSPAAQLFLDAFEYEVMRKCLDSGAELDEGQERRRAELEAKKEHHARLSAELAERRKERSREGGRDGRRVHGRRKKRDRHSRRPGPDGPAFDTDHGSGDPRSGDRGADVVGRTCVKG